MATKFMKKWDQYALMADLTLKLEGVSPQFGKTVLQKLVYILQTLYKVPCGYDFRLYNYGPYSAQLANDLDFFETLEGVSIGWSKGRGYKIEKAAKTEHFRKRGKAFLDEYNSKIKNTVEEFGTMSAKELELRSTIIYASKEEALDKETLLSQVKQIKPQFEPGHIKNAYEELEKWL